MCTFSEDSKMIIFIPTLFVRTFIYKHLRPINPFQDLHTTGPISEDWV